MKFSILPVHLQYLTEKPLPQHFVHLPFSSVTIWNITTNRLYYGTFYETTPGTPTIQLIPKMTHNWQIIPIKPFTIYFATVFTVSGSLLCMVLGMCDFLTIYLHYFFSIVFVERYWKSRNYLLVLWKFFYTYKYGGWLTYLIQNKFLIFIIGTNSSPDVLFIFVYPIFLTLTNAMVIDPNFPRIHYIQYVISYLYNLIYQN